MMVYRLVAYLALLTFAAKAGAQDVPPVVHPVVLPGTHQYDLTSSVNGQPYRLYVAPPEGYTASDTTRYPVLYVLDGYYGFPVAVSARTALSQGEEMGEVIIVGIGDGEHGFNSWLTNRWRDYTPSVSDNMAFLYAAKTGIPREDFQPGGAPEFLRVVQEEVIPFIDETYRTLDDRGLSGHSFGGLFATYALFEAPGLFQRVAINSPSLWWNEREMLGAEVAFAEANTALPAHVFLSVGSEEGSLIVPPMLELAESLRSREHEGLTVEAVVFEDETHVSVIPAMMSRGLRVLYPLEE